MRKIPITLTLPEDLIRDLHLYIPPRQMSKFIAQQVVKGLDKEKLKFAKEFREASHDKDRKNETDLWDTLSGEGLDETNAY